MQAIHGFSEDVIGHEHSYDGTVGLKEVHFIVKSKLMQLAAGEIDGKVALRPATCNGLTSGQVAFKKRIEHQINSVEIGLGIHGTGENMWTGENKPRFFFSSFAPLEVAGVHRVYDGLTVTRNDIRKLQRRHWQVVRNIQQRTGCQIKVVEEEYRGETAREIGFSGPKGSVVKAKKTLIERLVGSFTTYPSASANVFKGSTTELKVRRDWRRSIVSGALGLITLSFSKMLLSGETCRWCLRTGWILG